MRRWAAIFHLLLFLGIAMPAHAIEVTGHLPDLRFQLMDDRGAPFSQDDVRGKVVLMYFGFTGCAEQCPLAMQQLTKMLQAIGPQAKDVRVLFVTVDPTHDTAEMLHLYLQHFDSTHMVGLTGAPSDLRALAKRYRSIYPLTGKGEPLHSDAIYLFDREGRARALLQPEDKMLQPMVQHLLQSEHAS